MTDILPAKSPWTPEEVEKLNIYQNSGVFHPYTCGNHTCRNILRATENGWVCDICGYTQDWYVK